MVHHEAQPPPPRNWNFGEIFTYGEKVVQLEAQLYNAKQFNKWIRHLEGRKLAQILHFRLYWAYLLMAKKERFRSREFVIEFRIKLFKEISQSGTFLRKAKYNIQL